MQPSTCCSDDQKCLKLPLAPTTFNTHSCGDVVFWSCSDICASTVRVQSSRWWVYSISAGRHTLHGRRHTAGDQQGRSQLVAGTSLGHHADRRSWAHPISRAAGMACRLHLCRTCKERRIEFVIMLYSSQTLLHYWNVPVYSVLWHCWLGDIKDI